MDYIRNDGLTLLEASRVHQVNPLKFGTDLTCFLIGEHLYWHGWNKTATVVMWGPPVVASLVVLNMDLSEKALTTLGSCTATNMKLPDMMVRFLGLSAAISGAKRRSKLGLTLGVGLASLGWVRTLRCYANPNSRSR